MAKAEARVVVEYIIELPADIVVSKVDAFIKNEIDEGADSENIKSRIVTDVAFAERPGIVEKYKAVYQALDLVEGLLDVSKDKDTGAEATIEAMRPIVTEIMDQVSDEEDEEDGKT